jgi:hypothetical protein
MSGFSTAEDGLLGLAYQSLSRFQAPPVFQSLVAQGRVPEPIFGVNGNRVLGNAIDSGTSIIFGDTNSVRTVYENIPGSATFGGGRWTCTLSSARFRVTV